MPRAEIGGLSERTPVPRPPGRDSPLVSISQGPSTPKGGCTGVLVSEMEGRGPFFSFARVVTYTPQMYAQWTQLVERITMVLLFFRKDSISRFFLFFCRKNFVVDEKSTFHHHYHFSSDHTSTSFIDIHMGFHFL